MAPFLLIALAAVAIFLYFLPTAIALTTAGGHRQRVCVYTTNFFAGWTVLGWVLALVIATWNFDD